MREIKFRALDKEDGRFIDFCSVAFKENWVFFEEEYKPNHFSELSFHKDDIELMQYTGLKDKNGVEIYKSYLLKDDDGLIFEVVEDNRIAGTGYRIKLCKNDTQIQKHLKIGQCYDFLSWYYPDVYIEVIGNIHQNKELLNE